MIGSVPTKDTQNPPPPSILNFDLTFMKDAECAESSNKLIFRFSFFKLS